MSDYSVSVAATFTRDIKLQVPVRPWENKSPLQVDVSLNTTWRPLATDGHYAVAQTAGVRAVNEEGVLCLEASVTVELVGIISNCDDLEERRSIVENYFPPILFPTARARLATLTMDTGYGVMHLPVLQANQIPVAQRLAE
jgi:preprotein translocase subunit SecB